MDKAAQYKQDNPERNVSVVGIRDGEGNILLVRTKKLDEWWQPIGGGIEPEDKTPEAAAVREIAEELGIQVNTSELTLKLTTPYDFGKGTVYFYETRVDRTKTTLIVEENLEECRWFSPQEAQHLKAFPATQTHLRTLVA